MNALSYYTPFQHLLVRWLTSIYLFSLFAFYFPYMPTIRQGFNPDLDTGIFKLSAPIIRALLAVNFPLDLFFGILCALSLLLALNFFRKSIASFFCAIWISEFALTSLANNQATFVIPAILIFIAYPSSKSWRLVWLVFLATLTFSVAQTFTSVIDLLHFGLKADPKDSHLIGVLVNLGFLLTLLIRGLRGWGWLGLFIYSLLQVFLYGFQQYPLTITLSCLVIFNGHWFTSPADEKIRPIVFFDGICGFCNRFVQLLVNEDPGQHFYYAPLQGVTAKDLLSREDQLKMASLVFYSEGKSYYRSRAIIKIFEEVGGIWTVAVFARILPRLFLDKLYDFVAANRYHWFGSITYCQVPVPEQRELFKP